MLLCQLLLCLCSWAINIEKIIFKVVIMKFLAMHITNQKLSFDIVTVWNKFTQYINGTRSLLNVLMIFVLKVKWIILTHTLFLAIATNIPQRFKTGFVHQGHIWLWNHRFISSFTSKYVKLFHEGWKPCSALNNNTDGSNVILEAQDCGCVLKVQKVYKTMFWFMFVKCSDQF